MKKIALLAPLVIAGTALAEGEVTVPAAATQMFSTASTFIAGLETPLSTMLIAAFGVVLIFVAYKLAKRGINKV